MMFDTNNVRTTELGKLSLLVEDEIDSFQMRGVEAIRIGDNIVARCPESYVELGGRHRVTEDLAGLHDWLVKKARLYGGA